MRKVTVSAMADDIAMQLVDRGHRLSIPVQTENCIFHKWTTKLHPHPENNEVLQEMDYALVEFPDGVMYYVRPEQVVFQPENN